MLPTMGKSLPPSQQHIAMFLFILPRQDIVFVSVKTACSQHSFFVRAVALAILTPSKQMVWHCSSKLLLTSSRNYSSATPRAFSRYMDRVGCLETLHRSIVCSLLLQAGFHTTVHALDKQTRCHSRIIERHPR